MRSRCSFFVLLGRRRTSLWLALILAVARAAVAAEPQWTAERIEKFLLEARILRTSTISEGITHSTRATLQQGDLIHDAHIQDVDVSKPAHPTATGWDLNFRDSYLFNIAAYRLDRLLGLGMTPVSVFRTINGKSAAVTWWVDDVLMDEKTRYLRKHDPPDRTRWNRQMYCVRVFDELIYNTDRNLGNLLITTDWRVWMIDHTRAFRRQERLRRPQNLVKCDRQLLQTLREIDPQIVDRELKRYLNRSEIQALLARRDAIVQHFEQQIAERGERRVLFDFLAKR